jgi:hypothetical protein
MRLQLESVNHERALDPYRPYDTDQSVLNTAYSRFGQTSDEPIVVTFTQPHEAAADGSPQRSATARIGEGENSGEQQILFRLVNNRWLRAS